MSTYRAFNSSARPSSSARPTHRERSTPFRLPASAPSYKSVSGGPSQPVEEFHLSATMPSRPVIDELIRIQEASPDALYLLCPFYKAPSCDAQPGVTETPESSDPDLGYTAHRGAGEELQADIPRENIVPRPDLNFGRNTTFLADVRSAGPLSRYTRAPETRSPDKSRGKAFVAVFGRLENFTDIMSSFVAGTSDQITHLMLVPLSQLGAIWTYHEANPADFSDPNFFRYPRAAQSSHSSHQTGSWRQSQQTGAGYSPGYRGYTSREEHHTPPADHCREREWSSATSASRPPPPDTSHYRSRGAGGSCGNRKLGPSTHWSYKDRA